MTSLQGHHGTVTEWGSVTPMAVLNPEKLKPKVQSRYLNPTFLLHMKSVLLSLGSGRHGRLGLLTMAVNQLTFTLASAKPPAVFAFGAAGDLLGTSVWRRTLGSGFRAPRSSFLPSALHSPALPCYCGQKGLGSSWSG